MVEGKFRFACFVDEHPSHFHAFAGIERRLKDAGHEVWFFTPGKLAQRITAEGIRHITVGFLSSKISNRVELDRKLKDIRIEAERIVITFKPDLLIFDPFLLFYYPAFHRSGIPAVSISTKPLLTTDTLVPPYTSSVIPSDTARGRMRVQFARWQHDFRYLSYRIGCAWHAMTAGFSHRSLMIAIAKDNDFNLGSELNNRRFKYDMRFKSVPELVLHARELDFPRKKPLSGPGAYLGPCIDLPASNESPAAPPGAGPLIFVNLGSIAASRRRQLLHLYTCLLEAIENIPEIRAVIATADEWITARLNEINRMRRVLICTWTPRGSHLRIADLVVNHGGSNSVKEAILAGKPMLSIPYTNDQPGMAARLVYHGLGIMCRQATGKELRLALLALLSDMRYRKRVADMREKFSAYDRESTCVHILENAARGVVPFFNDD